VDRREELEFLDKKYKEKGFEFVIVSGRRRTGKSRLLKEFVKDKENIFLLCEERRWQYNLSKFNKAVGEYFGIPKPNFNSFSDCFDFIVKQGRERERLIVVIDEFSYLIRRSAIIAEFQTIVDEILSEKEIMLVLSGSAVNMMKKRVLGYKSPLYGRSTGQIFLQPLRFRDLREWFPKVKIEDLIKIYAVCDGTPKYLEFFSGIDVEEEIKENVFNPESFLFREPKSVFEEDLEEPETYFQILEAISLGHTKGVEIANHSFLESRNVYSYLSILESKGFVKKEHSVPDMRRVGGSYRMKDNFFAFWFRFISRYFSELETWEIEGAWSDFKCEFDSHLGFTFEKIAMDFLIEKKPFRVHRIGRWWHRDKEIDLVALNEETKEIIFVDVKWGDLKLGEARKIMVDLKEKSRFVNWDNEERIEHFGVIAKRIEGKEKLMAEGYLCYDLDDIEDIMKTEGEAR